MATNPRRPDHLPSPDDIEDAAPRKQWSPDLVAEQRAKADAQEISNEIGRQKVAQQKADIARTAEQQRFWAAATELLGTASRWLAKR